MEINNDNGRAHATNGARLRELRQGKGLTQNDLASAAKCNESTVKKAEHGGPCHLNTICAIAHVLQVNHVLLMLDYDEYQSSADEDEVNWSADADEGGRPATTESGVPSVAVESAAIDLEITINRDINDYSERDQKKTDGGHKKLARNRKGDQDR